MNNEEYVRRVMRIEARIERMFPLPPGDWDRRNETLPG